MAPYPPSPQELRVGVRNLEQVSAPRDEGAHRPKELFRRELRVGYGQLLPVHLQHALVGALEADAHPDGRLDAVAGQRRLGVEHALHLDEVFALPDEHVRGELKYLALAPVDDDDKEILLASRSLIHLQYISIPIILTIPPEF